MAIEEASTKVAIFIEQNLKCFAKFLFWLVVAELREDFNSLTAANTREVGPCFATSAVVG